MIYDKIISQYGFGLFLIATLAAEYLLKQISSLTVIQLYILCLPCACFLCVYIADNIGNEILKWKKLFGFSFAYRQHYMKIFS